MATQALTVDGDGAIRTGWDAEGYDYTRLQSDDGNTSKIYSPTLNDVVSFSVTDTSGLFGATINFLEVFAKVATLAPYDAAFRLGVGVGSTNYFDSSINHFGDTYTLYSSVFTTNPATGLAWTTSELDDVEIVIIRDDGDGLRVTYMYAEVDYTEDSGTVVKDVLEEGIIPFPR